MPCRAPRRACLRAASAGHGAGARPAGGVAAAGACSVCAGGAAAAAPGGAAAAGRRGRAAGAAAPAHDHGGQAPHAAQPAGVAGAAARRGRASAYDGAGRRYHLPWAGAAGAVPDSGVARLARWRACVCRRPGGRDGGCVPAARRGCPWAHGP